MSKNNGIKDAMADYAGLYVFDLPVIQFTSLSDFAAYLEMGDEEDRHIFDTIIEVGAGFVSRFATITKNNSAPMPYVAVLSYLRPRMIVIDERGRETHGTEAEQMEYQRDEHARLITELCDFIPDAFIYEGVLPVPNWVQPVYVTGYRPKKVLVKPREAPPCPE